MNLQSDKKSDIPAFLQFSREQVHSAAKYSELLNSSENSHLRHWGVMEEFSVKQCEKTEQTREKIFISVGQSHSYSNINIQMQILSEWTFNTSNLSILIAV